MRITGRRGFTRTCGILTKNLLNLMVNTGRTCVLLQESFSPTLGFASWLCFKIPGSWVWPFDSVTASGTWVFWGVPLSCLVCWAPLLSLPSLVWERQTTVMSWRMETQVSAGPWMELPNRPSTLRDSNSNHMCTCMLLRHWSFGVWISRSSPHGLCF